MQLICDDGNIDRVIAQALKIADRVQKLGHLLGLSLGHFLSGQLHQISAKLILILINQIFLLLHLGKLLPGIILHQRNRASDIFPRLFRHSVHRHMTLHNRKRRIRQKTLLQKIKVRCVLDVLRCIPHQKKYKFLNILHKRQQQRNCCRPVDGIHQRDGKRAHHHIHKRKMYNCIGRVKHHRPEHHPEQVVIQVHQRRPPSVPVRPDRG